MICGQALRCKQTWLFSFFVSHLGASWVLVRTTASEDQAGLRTGAGVLASRDPGRGRPRALSDVGREG